MMSQLTTSSQLSETGWAMTRWMPTSSQLGETGWAMTRWMPTSSQLGETGWAMNRWMPTSSQLGETGWMMLRSRPISLQNSWPLGRIRTDSQNLDPSSLRLLQSLRRCESPPTIPRPRLGAAEPHS